MEQEIGCEEHLQASLPPKKRFRPEPLLNRSSLQEMQSDSPIAQEKESGKPEPPLVGDQSFSGALPLAPANSIQGQHLLSPTQTQMGEMTLPAVVSSPTVQKPKGYLPPSQATGGRNALPRNFCSVVAPTPVNPVIPPVQISSLSGETLFCLGLVGAAQKFTGLTAIPLRALLDNLIRNNVGTPQANPFQATTVTGSSYVPPPHRGDILCALDHTLWGHLL